MFKSGDVLIDKMAIEIEDEWQTCQDHMEHGSFDDALFFANRMTDKLKILKEKLKGDKEKKYASKWFKSFFHKST